MTANKNVPIKETSKPTRLSITEILQYRSRVGKIFLTSILLAAIRLDNLVLLNVQKLFKNAIATPMALKEKPDAHSD